MRGGGSEGRCGLGAEEKGHEAEARGRLGQGETGKLPSAAAPGSERVPLMRLCFRPGRSVPSCYEGKVARLPSRKRKSSSQPLPTRVFPTQSSYLFFLHFKIKV